MKLNEEPQWIRLAGHSERMRTGSGPGWRCFMDLTGEEITFDKLEVIGQCNPENTRIGYDPNRDHLGLLAWFDYYGLAELKGDKLTIRLK